MVRHENRARANETMEGSGKVLDHAEVVIVIIGTTTEDGTIMDIVNDGTTRFEESMTFKDVIHLYFHHVALFPVKTFISLCMTRGGPSEFFYAEARPYRSGGIEEVMVPGNESLLPDSVSKR